MNLNTILTKSRIKLSIPYLLLVLFLASINNLMRNRLGDNSYALRYQLECQPFNHQNCWNWYDIENLLQNPATPNDGYWTVVWDGVRYMYYVPFNYMAQYSLPLEGYHNRLVR